MLQNIGGGGKLKPGEVYASPGIVPGIPWSSPRWNPMSYPGEEANG